MATAALPKIQATRVFEDNWLSKTRITANEGGARSSKTVSLVQNFILSALQEKEPNIYSIVRKTSPALRATVERDFFEWLIKLNLYNPKNHRKTDNTYQLGKTLIEFFAVDEPQKVKGRKRKKLWVNEANELDLEDWRQLILRTTGQIYLDYNPSDTDHWIYDYVLSRPDCNLIKSSYLDNPFLDDFTIAEIERLKEEDESFWKVFGLGLRAVATSRIYNHFQIVDELPEDFDDEIGGLDFGYNNPSCLVRIRFKDRRAYVKEEIYQSHLTNPELIELFKKIGWDPKIKIYADAAEPARIKEFCDAGFWVEKSNKEVKSGIDNVKSTPVSITKDSVHILEEKKKYSYKQKGDKILDEPIKTWDHAMDAVRYGIHTHQAPEMVITKPNEPRIRFL